MTPTPTGPKFVTLPEIRRAAREKLPRDHWNFGDGAAETESSKRRNRRHLDRLAIQQNVLVDVRNIDLRTTLLGVPLSWPVAVAPMGGLILFNPEGDVEMARGSGKGDTLQWLERRHRLAGGGRGQGRQGPADVSALRPRRPRLDGRAAGARRGVRLQGGGAHGRRAEVQPARARRLQPLQPAQGHGGRAESARTAATTSSRASPGRTSSG